MTFCNVRKCRGNYVPFLLSQHICPHIGCSHPIISSCHHVPPPPPLLSNIGFRYLIWDPTPQVMGEAGGGCARVGGGGCLHRHDISAGGGGGGDSAGVLSREPRDGRVRLLKERSFLWLWLCHVYHDEVFATTSSKNGYKGDVGMRNASMRLPHLFPIVPKQTKPYRTCHTKRVPNVYQICTESYQICSKSVPNLYRIVPNL